MRIFYKQNPIIFFLWPKKTRTKNPNALSEPMINEEIPQFDPDLLALKKLLEHPVFVVRQLAKDLYEEDGPAAY